MYENSILFGKPKCGWVNMLFQTDDNWDKPIPLSYVDDVPVILGEALEKALNQIINFDVGERVPFSVRFDGEGKEYEINNILGRICISWDGSEKGTSVISYLLFPEEFYADEAIPIMAHMLAADVRDDIDAWTEWDSSLPLREMEPEAYKKECAERKAMLFAMCDRLEQLANEAQN